MARALDGAIAERSRNLLGLLTTAHLDALGVTRQQRRTLVARGVLVPVHRGVLRHAAHPTSWRQSVLAGVLATGDAAVASHRTAAMLWRFDGFDRPGCSPVEVTVPRARQRRPPGEVVVHRTASLDRADVDLRRGIPRTSPARTLCDIAPGMAVPRLEATFDHAVRRGLIWPPHVRWRLDELRRRGRTGPAMVADLLDHTQGRPQGDSWLEQEGVRIIAEAGLPTPRCQVKLRKAGGGIARVDLFWDRGRLVAELDGHASHATRRQRQSGAERAARLELSGWRVLAFTYEDVTERPGYVVATIRAHLAQRS
jgi:hypothetical protein